MIKIHMWCVANTVTIILTNLCDVPKNYKCNYTTCTYIHTCIYVHVHVYIYIPLISFFHFLGADLLSALRRQQRQNVFWRIYNVYIYTYMYVRTYMNSSEDKLLLNLHVYIHVYTYVQCMYMYVCTW